MAAYLNGNGILDKTTTENGDHSIDSIHNNKAFEDTKGKILGLTSYSSRLEEVLLALLRDQETLKDRFDHEIHDLSSRLDADRDKLSSDLSKLTGELEQKINTVQDTLQDNLQHLDKKFEDNAQALQEGVQGLIQVNILVCFV